MSQDGALAGYTTEPITNLAVQAWHHSTEDWIQKALHFLNTPRGRRRDNVNTMKIVNSDSI